MKVLVADKFEDSGLAGLRSLGVEIAYEPDLKDTTLAARLAEEPFDVLIVRSTKVSAEMIENSRLGLIVRAGAGYNTIDVGAASARGVLVANCPGKNSQAVAELAFGLLLACDRKIADNVAQLREGKWNKAGFSKARGLYGRTLGLIGMGNISQEMIQRARGFGMNVVAYSRWMSPEIAAALGIGRAANLIELAQQSDFVSVHVSLTKETRGMLDKKFFDAMRNGAVFINTSRGEVVDQAAMLEALDTKELFAGLDVFEGEPEGGKGSYEGPLANNPRIYATHHIGASTEQAQEAVADETVRIVREYLLTGMVPNVVNVKRGEAASHVLIVRHADRVGVLAHVLEILKGEGVSVQEMENVILGGAQAAIAQISVDKEPSPAATAAIKLNANVFDVNVMAIQR
ncbi:phosphoglycerate dehydrogenase [Fimbriimonas ginsengisoli]|uniref:D-3-phosphoglycerate dehydrogenase n=1 Tax=Fimbriimonas ginsengisoli Gsoil 348 TaxID=661478 RepID=A0A068NNQ2_FIMGI|nr:phosphoglycerate dehydrogenase [Fimbriimonas ginsengisoli]AIE84390.1 D-isomer specific 2-hydroxyacid dehydrogenase [Fimbriimonas ginsengisoli Gsoil 348]